MNAINAIACGLSKPQSDRDQGYHVGVEVINVVKMPRRTKETKMRAMRRRACKAKTIYVPSWLIAWASNRADT